MDSRIGFRHKFFWLYYHTCMISSLLIILIIVPSNQVTLFQPSTVQFFLLECPIQPSSPVRWTQPWFFSSSPLKPSKLIDVEHVVGSHSIFFFFFLFRDLLFLLHLLLFSHDLLSSCERKLARLESSVLMTGPTYILVLEKLLIFGNIMIELK